MKLSEVKIGKKVLYKNQQGEIAYIPTFFQDKEHKSYNCVEVSLHNYRDALGSLINIAELTEIKTIEVTENNLISCDSEICTYCQYFYQKAILTCTDCDDKYSNFLGIEAYRTQKD